MDHCLMPYGTSPVSGGMLEGLLLALPALSAPHFNLVPFSPVSQPQAAHAPLEKPASTAILCNTCGNVCKGEVLRVQNKYFHIRCFVCKGECVTDPVLGHGVPQARLPSQSALNQASQTPFLLFFGPESSLDTPELL